MRWSLQFSVEEYLNGRISSVYSWTELVKSHLMAIMSDSDFRDCWSDGSKFVLRWSCRHAPRNLAFRSLFRLCKNSEAATMDWALPVHQALCWPLLVHSPGFILQAALWGGYYRSLTDEGTGHKKVKGNLSMVKYSSGADRLPSLEPRASWFSRAAPIPGIGDR